MKFSFFLFLILISTVLLGQKKKNKGENFHWVSQQWVVAVSGGQFQPDMNLFNTKLTGEGAKSVFFEGLRGYGMSFVEPINISKKAKFDGAAGFNYLLASKVSIGKNDSLTYRMSGWKLMTSTFGKDLIPGNVVALVLSPGIDWGSFKMIRSIKGTGGLYRNGYIAPFGRAELRFVFGFVALGARGVYRYDISKDSWKQKSGSDFILPGTKNTGTSIEFFIGWGHVHFE